jgi:hypothetical protein
MLALVALVARETRALTIDGLITLYDPIKDDIEILTKRTFNSLVYKSDSVWFVEFYAHWCGSCQRYSKNWKEVAKETKAWHTKMVKVAAINCGDPFNDDICNDHHVDHYPTLKLFPVQASHEKQNHDAIEVRIDKTDVIVDRLINYIEQQSQKPVSWPELEPYT